jgi:S-phase kinase-associated protein 1
MIGSVDNDLQTFISKEGDIITANRNHMKLNTLIKEMCDDYYTNETMHLPNVSSKDLIKVVEFCNHFHNSPMKNIEKPLRSNHLDEFVNKWYADFINLPKNDVFDLVLAANYLDNKPLLELSCAKVATLIKGKSPEEIRNVFNVENDFTPEEEMRVKEDNMWIDSFGANT